jgi:Protein of unknown function (DUF3592)
MGLKGRDKMGAGCLSLFALPFAGVGVGAFYFLGSMLWTWHQMASWVPVPTEIVSLDLESHRGDDATTHKVVANYRYSFDGRDYAGDRVAIASMSDNIGSFQQDLYRSLKRAQARRAAVAFVDPANPGSSTLNRDLRWLLVGFEAMFGLIFGGVGFGLLIGARIGGKKLAAERDLEQRFPTTPWRWRDDWKDGRIATSNRANAYGATIFAVLWNLISLPVVFFMPAELAHGNWLALIAFIFPAVGIGLAVWAIRSWLRLKRFKAVTLVLDHVPVPLGGRLRGTIKVDTFVPVTGEFKLRLNCVERRRSGSNNESNERLLWQNESSVPRHVCQLAPMYSTIPVNVEVPADLPESSTAKDNDRIAWRLEITGECPGPDFVSTFEVPVFAVAEAGKAPTRAQPKATGPVAAMSTSPSTGDWLDRLEADEAARATQRAAADPSAPSPDRLAALGIVYELLPGGREAWTFRRGQQVRVALGLTVMTLVWSAISVGLWFSSAPLLFPIAFGLFDAIFVWWTLHLWFAEYRVTLDERMLTITARSVTGTRRCEIPREQIVRVRARRGMQAGNKLYYDLKVDTLDRKSRTAATSLPDYAVAEWLAERWMGRRTNDADRAAPSSLPSNRSQRRAAS